MTNTVDITVLAAFSVHVQYFYKQNSCFLKILSCTIIQSQKREGGPMRHILMLVIASCLMVEFAHGKISGLSGNQRLTFSGNIVTVKSPESTQLTTLINDPKNAGREVLRAEMRAEMRAEIRAENGINTEIHEPANIRFYMPARVQLTDEEIQNHLKILFESPIGRENYYAYFQMGQTLPLLNYVSQYYGKLVSEGDFHFNPYDPIDYVHAIVFQVPTELKSLPAEDKNCGICVLLDGITGAVPIGAADSYAFHFASGFVTRIMLGEMVDQLRTSGRIVDDIDLDLILKSNPNPPATPEAYRKLDSYKKGKTFDDSLQILMEQNSLQSIGIIRGWQAAGKLDAKRNGPENKYFQAAWALARNRFSPTEMGEICSYTLSFLAGFSKVAAINAEQGSLYGKDTEILNKLRDDANANSVKQLSNELFCFCLNQFYAASIDSDFTKETGAYGKLCKYKEFLSGWQNGNLMAADDIFNETFKCAYGIGYRDGYKDAYSKGFAQGCKEGYAKGWKEAWAQANQIINHLNNELKREKSIDNWITRIGGVAVIVASLL